MTQNFEYIISNSVLSEFVKLSSACFSDNGDHKETLAFLAGFRRDNVLTATELLLPEQFGSTSEVEDRGIKFNN